MGGQQSVPIEGARAAFFPPAARRPLANGAAVCTHLSAAPRCSHACARPLAAEQIFNMQFTARQLNKLSEKSEKDCAKEKKKIKAVSSQTPPRRLFLARGCVFSAASMV